jgi:hypothetical protein
MKRIGLHSLIWLLFLIPSARGQVGLYAGFSATSTNEGNEPWFYGTTFGGYYTGWKLPLINLGLNARASLLHGSGSVSPQKFVNGLVGPRAQLHLPLVPLKPHLAVWREGPIPSWDRGVPAPTRRTSVRIRRRRRPDHLPPS